MTRIRNDPKKNSDTFYMSGDVTVASSMIRNCELEMSRFRYKIRRRVRKEKIRKINWKLLTANSKKNVTRRGNGRVSRRQTPTHLQSDYVEQRKYNKKSKNRKSAIFFRCQKKQKDE